MKTMCSVTGLVAALSIGLSGSLVSAATDLTLARRGQAADCSIVVAAKATPSQRYAAEELAKYIEKGVGVKLPIVESAKGAARHIVISGDDSQGDDGFRLCVRGDDLQISGGKRGVLYGAYEILERFGGVGWYASWHEVVPRIDALSVPRTLDDAQKPAFEVRKPLWSDTRDGDFAARMRVNGDYQRLEERHGGHAELFSSRLGLCHTFNYLVPPDKWFDRHPEWFCMVNGDRLKAVSQLCLTNPELLAFVIDRVKEEIRREPQAKYFGVSQNDWDNHCQCPACKAVEAEEGSPAGPVVRFVNAIAEAVEKEFPGRVIETLAYQYSRKPPKKTRLRHNVMPCLCTIECDFSRPLATSPYPSNVSFVEDIRGWAAQTDKLYIWDYTTNFANYPHAFPNVYSLQDNIRFFRDNHVVSLLEQGNYGSRHADFGELKTWLLSKWMWNPELPAKPLLDRFFTGYYGKAAPYVRDYFEKLQKKMLTWAGDDPNRSLTIFEGVSTPALDDEFLAWADRQWQLAEQAVAGEPAVYGYNVRMGSFSTGYTRLMRNSRKIWVTRHPERYSNDAATPERAQRLLDLQKEGCIRIAESQGAHDGFLSRCRYMLKASAGQGAAADSAQVAAADVFNVWTGDVAMDTSSAFGKSVHLTNTHFQWSGSVTMNQVAYDENAEYAIRLRLRVNIRKDAPPDTEVFWAGMYDPVNKAGLAGGLSLKARDASEEWTWYDIGTFKLKDPVFLWIGPGRFEKAKVNPAHDGIWIDCVEFRRVSK